jgi:site-specific DNA recombinase
MKSSSVKPVRCAIYTRVSTEHGLDQEFNSLDAQYGAASAYIKRQAHAGWTGANRGGAPFGRGSLFYLLRNRFYVGEVKYKDEILPGEQPAIMDRALFDAVQQKLTEQWSTRSTARNANAHLLTDSGHRLVPTHATKAGVRYRYYVSLPHLYRESKTASVGSISSVPATDIEDTIVNSLKRLIIQKKKLNSSITGVMPRQNGASSSKPSD